MKKPFDLLILCDGRDRQVRRKLEDAIEAMPHVCEFWVVFSGNGRVSGAGRNVSFAASNRETIYVALPVPRTNLTKEDRDHFNACGETSTHYTSYSGVPPLTLSEAAKVNSSETEGDLVPPVGAGEAAPEVRRPERRSPPPRTRAEVCGFPAGLLAGCPFWQRPRFDTWERRPRSDLPPRVCPDARAPGISPEQARPRRPQLPALYHAGMAAHIKEHFADVVDPTIGQDPAEEPDEEDDEDSDEE